MFDIFVVGSIEVGFFFLLLLRFKFGIIGDFVVIVVIVFVFIIFMVKVCEIKNIINMN